MKDNIPFYSIANMFFVGAVFSIVNILLFQDRFFSIALNDSLYQGMKDWSVVITAAAIVIVFEIGFILNRLSSIVIEPVLAKAKMWPIAQYGLDVSALSKEHPKFQSMITDLVLMRTHILLYLILAVEALFSQYKLAAVVFLLLIVVFVLAGRKHNSKINKMREDYAKQDAGRSICEENTTDCVRKRVRVKRVDYDTTSEKSN